MWELYRKRLVITQLFILGLCVIAWFTYKQWKPVAVLFVVTQLGGIYGAWLGFRMKRRIEAHRNELEPRKRK